MTAPKSTQAVATQLHSELSSIKIPPRPAALSSIENEMRSKAPNFGAMAMLISVDVGISASLLKLANSAYFGQGGRVRSVSEALQILGLNTVATSIAALSLRKVFAHVPNLERYWDSSARVALLSGWLVTQIHFPERKIKPEEAYTFGLFRDCGIPILMSMYDDYFDILERANSEDEKSFTAVEFDVLGLDHAMIGGSLATEWRLPIEFKAAIELHHDADAICGLNPHIAPDVSRYFIAIAQLSEYLFQRLSGLNKTREWHKLGAVCLAVLGIQEKDTDQLFQHAQEKKIHAQPAF
jgi:HD-like signal output (HDOD) protein